MDWVYESEGSVELAMPFIRQAIRVPEVDVTIEMTPESEELAT